MDEYIPFQDNSTWEYRDVVIILIRTVKVIPGMPFMPSINKVSVQICVEAIVVQ